MNLKRIIIMPIFLLVIAFLNISIAYSACSTVPESIGVKSSNIDLGTFEIGDSVFVKPDMSTDSLELTIYLSNTDSLCYDTSDIKVRLFPTGNFVEVDSITSVDNENGGLTTAKILFSGNYRISSSTTVTIDVAGTHSNLYLFADEIVPQIDLFSNIESIYKSGEEITLDFNINDMGSGLDSVTFSGPFSQVIDLDANQTLEKSITFVMTSSQDLVVTAKDMLGNLNQKIYSIVADGAAPLIENLVKENYVYDGNSRSISFKVDLDDESFALGYAPVVFADFSQFNSDLKNKRADYCSSDDLDTNKYTCYFENVEIKLESTKKVNIPINATDIVGNSRVRVFSNVEIFVDSSSPEILDFYVINSVGSEDIFSAKQRKNTLVYLRVKDRSLVEMEGSDLYLEVDFDRIDGSLMIPQKTVKDDSITYVYNISELTRAYSDIETESVEFSVTVMDQFSNFATETWDVKVDNIEPQITEINLIETEDLKDRVIKSGEKVNFRIYINDSNLNSGDEFNVFSNLQLVGTNILEDVKGSCAISSGDTYECNFNNIIARNGYLKKNVTFYAIDRAGNVGEKSHIVEILKIGDEVTQAYKVIDTNAFNPSGSVNNLYILNPINRNALGKNRIDAWFSGKLELINPTENFSLLNYGLKSCSWKNNETIKIIENELYPSDDGIIYFEEKGDDEFAIKIELQKHPDFQDMNDMKMNCILSVLKRDAENVYGTNLDNAELVNVTLHFSFYANPKGDIVKARAGKVMDYIEEAEELEEGILSLWDIYETMDKVCRTVTAVNTVVGSIAAIVNTIANGFKFIEPAAQASNKADATVKYLNWLSPIQTMCGFVTCEYTALNFVKEWLGELQGNLGEMMCKAIVLDDGSAEGGE